MNDKKVSLGYTDTPLIPGQTWRVHDDGRPLPPVVSPGDGGSLGAPSDAVILFDGTDLSAWKSTSGEGPAEWKVENGYMEVAPGTGNIQTREHFGNCQIHLEWTPPSVIEGHSQGRGNSGIFLMGIYEIQVLDGYQNPTYADGSTGAIYGQHPPLVNACRAPGRWQAFDIVFEASVFENDTLVRPAYATVVLNGVVLHHHAEILGPTANRQTLPYEPHPPKGPLELQNHRNPVRFRNIWIRPMP